MKETVERTRWNSGRSEEGPAKAGENVIVFSLVGMLLLASIRLNVPLSCL